MSDNGTPLLQAVDLGRTYTDGQVQALRSVNLTIHVGEYVALMGHSGCGKSTLLSLLGALDRPTAGSVLFEGRSLNEWGNLDRLRSRKIGFIFQSFCLLPTLTALENVQVPMFEGRLDAKSRSARASELLALVGLTHRKSHLPSRLSVGERQRVAIARALANKPALLLADEPTGNLDTKTTKEILELFAQLHREQDMTLLMVTHSEEVAHYAQRIVRLRDGQVIDDHAVA